MHEEEELIRTFYTCFQRLDWRGMLACYRDDIFFYDPVFEDLQGREVGAMWEMLLSKAKDLEFSFSAVTTDGEGYGSCEWIAVYTFSATGRRVINKGKALFKFTEGRISEHQDVFDLWKWSRQALGLSGLLLGWTPVMQKKIRRRAAKNLDKFLSARYPDLIR